MAIRGGFVAPVHNANISQVAASARRTLGVIAIFGSDDAEEAKTGFQSAMKIAGLEAANMPTKDAVNFCKRVGEKGEEPRPLVVGFHEESTRKRVLRGAKI